MHSWFTCRISYEKVLENGLQKKVTEPYLVDALSFYRGRSQNRRRDSSFYIRGIYRCGYQTSTLQ